MPPVPGPTAGQADAAEAGGLPQGVWPKGPPPPFQNPAPCASTRPVTAHPAMLSLVFPTVLKALPGTQVLEVARW